MRLQEAALLCVVLTVVAGRRAFTQTRNIPYVDRFTFLSLLAIGFQRSGNVRVRVGEPEKRGRNRWNSRGNSTTFPSVSLWFRLFAVLTDVHLGDGETSRSDSRSNLN